MIDNKLTESKTYKVKDIRVGECFIHERWGKKRIMMCTSGEKHLGLINAVELATGSEDSFDPYDTVTPVTVVATIMPFGSVGYGFTHDKES